MERSLYKQNDAFSVPIPEGFNAHATIARLPETPIVAKLQQYGEFHSSLQLAPTIQIRESSSESLLLQYAKGDELEVDPIGPFLAIPFLVAVGILAGDIPPYKTSYKDTLFQTNIVEMLCGLLTCLQSMKENTHKWLGPFRKKHKEQDISKFKTPRSSTGEILRVSRRSKKNGEEESFGIEYLTKDLGSVRLPTESQYSYSAEVRCDREGSEDLVVDVDVTRYTWKKESNPGSRTNLVFNPDVRPVSLINGYFGKKRHHVPFLYGDPSSIDNAQRKILQSLKLDTLFQLNP